jgi:hypothetical protein
MLRKAGLRFAFGELIQQNDNSGKDHQLDVFILQHIFVSKGSGFKGSEVQMFSTMICSISFIRFIG